jgi:hypothetical protein
VKAVRANDSLQDPQDVCDVIEEVLQKDSLRAYIGPRCQAKATRWPSVGNWKAILGPDDKSGLHINLSGGLLKDDTANHSYTFLCRMGAWPDQTCLCSVVVGWGNGLLQS